jgi:two-component system chemotaxis response regulator CheB
VTGARTVAVGGSAGSIPALQSLLPEIPVGSPLSIVVVLHQHRSGKGRLAQVLARFTALPVRSIEDRDPIVEGHVFVAPADYHVYIEGDGAFSLSVDPPVAFARPSIDVFFESAAYAYGDQLVGVLLSGANTDGTQGLSVIKARGGLVICQEPLTAPEPTMPAAACAAIDVDLVAPSAEIGSFIARLVS